MLDFTFTAKLWLYPGPKASWVFATVPVDISSALRAFGPDAKRGFGSMRVSVQIGKTRWNTSVFPDSKSGCYFLPIKKAIRTAEGLSVGDDAEIRIELVA